MDRLPALIAAPYYEPCWICGYKAVPGCLRDLGPFVAEYANRRRAFCNNLILEGIAEDDQVFLACPTCTAIINGMSMWKVERLLRRPWPMRGEPLPQHLNDAVNGGITQANINAAVNAPSMNEEPIDLTCDEIYDSSAPM